ncbi:MAG TPA: 30S ribosomal protein S12 methylthiotransferase RimO [Coriobacteriia bacterium]|nr:30S ribosomal protein S12 methylthiotransferase RimO [Coriobacteriia bacterium]
MSESTTRPSVAFVTLGCPKNEVDTDRMRAAVASSAYRVADDPDEADVLVVNTCSFIQAATEESVEAVLEATSQWLRERAGRKVVVAGCMPSRYGSDLSEAMPEVDAFLPVSDEAGLLEIVECLTGVASGNSAGECASRTLSGASAYLQISDGCHRSCAYCTIPAIRGPYRSRQIADIVAEAAELVALGAKEIILIGQDTTAYGHDLAEEVVLADVLEAVAAVDGVRWLRLMYAQPDGVSDRLLEVMASRDNICHYLDMPLQHASKPVLRAMRRSGDAMGFLKLIERIRGFMPDVVLRTTMIAGFPGETRADAAALTRFLEDARFDYVGVFPYSAEDGTDAAVAPDQVPTRTRLARTQRLRDLAESIGFQRVAALDGSELEVLVEGVDEEDGVVFGRWKGQAPEIDGLVLLDGGTPGELVKARIVDTLGYDLEGEVI